MIRFVNVKINLGLKVVDRRPDGYHNLDTVFIPVGHRCGLPGEPGSLCDILEITPAHEDKLYVTGADFDCPVEKNIVWKALCRYREAAPSLPPVAITLEKHLPSGAGLGAGSADAAFALLMLNEINSMKLTEKELHELAVGLGADVPFFLLNTPCHATGIGDILKPMSIPQLSGKWITIVKPEESISTAQAFAGVRPSPSSMPLTEALQLPVEDWKHWISNDFERSIYDIYPEMEAIKGQLYEQGAVYASMSGSGSSFYGIFADEESASNAAANSRLPFSTFARICL